MVRGSSGIAGVSRSLPIDHSLTWTDPTGDGILELFQVHSGTFVCLFVLFKSEAAILRFTRPQRTQATFQACNGGGYVCVSECGGPTLSSFQFLNNIVVQYSVID